jgi:hypothetical protein
VRSSTKKSGERKKKKSMIISTDRYKTQPTLPATPPKKQMEKKEQIESR